MSNYSPTGNPPSQTRGTSSTIRSEFNLISTAVNSKGDISGQTWTGTHTFPSTTYGVTAAFGASGTAYATLDYVNAVATNAALPGQASNAGKYLRTNGVTASWSELGVKGANVASAATVDLSSADGDLIHITGTTTITAITLPSGACRTVVFDGILTLTHNGTTLILPTAANIVTAAGDAAIIRGDGSGNVRVVAYMRASGDALLRPGLTRPIAVLTPTAAANVDALNVFSSSYDNYLILFNGILPASNDRLAIRMAVSGVVDSTAGHHSDGTYILVGSSIYSSGIGFSGSILITNANSAATVKAASIQGYGQRDAVPTYDTTAVSGAYLASNAISGVRLIWIGGANFAPVGKFLIFAYNNS